MEHAIRKYGDPDVKWSAQGMLRLTQEAMRKLFMPTVLKIKEAVGSVMVANSEKRKLNSFINKIKLIVTACVNSTCSLVLYKH